MSVIVKSVESFELSITATNRSATGTLTKGQTIANCVPYITAEVDTVGTIYLTDFCVDVYFDTDPSDEVVVERDSTNGALTVNVTVVEYDPTYVTVQSAAYQLTSAQATKAITITTVTDLANAYSIAYGYQGSGTPTYGRFQVRSRLTAETTLTVDRDTNNATWDGHWYVVEADDGDFSVQARTISLTGTSNTGTITSITENKTMLIGSCLATAGIPNTDDATLFCELTDDTTITVTRNASGGTMEWSGYAVTFASGETVQRNTIIAQGATASQDVTITSVPVANSMAIHSGNVGFLTGGSFPGGDVTDSTLDAQVRLTLTTPTNLQVTHDTTNSSADNDISWEVVTWDTGARRVMVVS